MSMVVILLGPPGVGKGTQAARLAEAISGEHISTGDLLRAARRDGTELGKQAQGFMDSGELVPDALILDLVRDHLAGLPSEASLLFDGFPRTTTQADGLDSVLSEVGRRVDRAVLLEAPEDTLVERLSGRRSCMDCGAIFNVHMKASESDGVCDECGGPLIHRIDDEPDTVLHRLHVYQEQTSPLVAHYDAHEAGLVRVRADRSMDDVYTDVRAAVGT
jgi:adenylate kinase